VDQQRRDDHAYTPEGVSQDVKEETVDVLVVPLSSCFLGLDVMFVVMVVAVGVTVVRRAC